MADWISENEVKQYLLRIKITISESRFTWEKNRRKNLAALSKAGLLPKHVPQIIMGLTHYDYFNGPEPEDNPNYPPGEYMFFGTNVNGIEFYIKIKIEQRNSQDYSICIGFHDADRPIIYAFKRKGGR